MAAGGVARPAGKRELELGRAGLEVLGGGGGGGGGGRRLQAGMGAVSASRAWPPLPEYGAWGVGAGSVRRCPDRALALRPVRGRRAGERPGASCGNPDAAVLQLRLRPPPHHCPETVSERDPSASRPGVGERGGGGIRAGLRGRPEEQGEGAQSPGLEPVYPRTNPPQSERSPKSRFGDNRQQVQQSRWAERQQACENLIHDHKRPSQYNQEKQ